MKRTISLLLAVIMLFALAACSKKAEPVDEPAGSETAEAAPEVDGWNNPERKWLLYRSDF